MGKILKRFIKVSGITIGILLLLLVGGVFSLRLEGVQHFITQKAVAFVSSKTHTKIQLRRLYIGFPKLVVIEQLYAEDQQHDTLLAVQKLSVDIDLWALTHKTVSLRSVDLTGVTANIYRNEDSIFNFDFFIKAFSSGKKAAASEKPKADTTGWTIDAGKLNLENIRAAFKDDVGGTAISGVIGKLNLDMKAIDLKHLSFSGNQLILQNTEVQMVQSKKGNETPDTSIVLMPLLALNKLQLQHVHFSFANKVNGQLYDIDCGNAVVLPQKIDLNEHIIMVKKLGINNTTVVLGFRKSIDTISVKRRVATNTTLNIGWQIAADDIKIDAVGFKMDFEGAPIQTAGFDYNHMQLNNICVDIKDAKYQADKISAVINNLTLHDKKGFTLKQLTTRATYSDKGGELKGLTLLTANSKITNHLAVAWASVNDIAPHPGEMYLQANLQGSYVALSDVLFFVPQLGKQTVFQNPSLSKLFISGNVSGKLNDIQASELRVQTADSTLVMLNAHIMGLPDALNANYDVDLKTVKTNGDFINQISGGKISGAVNLPKGISLTGKIMGSIKNAAAQLTLVTTSGNMNVNAVVKQVNADTTYTVDVTGTGLDVGNILKQKSLGAVSFKVNVSGQNFSPAAMVADAKVDVSSLKFNGYNYSGISLSANANRNRYSTLLNVDDPGVNLNLQALASFVKDSEYVHASAQIKGIDFEKLNLLKEKIRASGSLHADLTGPISNINGSARLSNVLVAKGGDNYHIDSFLIVSSNTEKGSLLTVSSPIVNAKYDGNVPVQSIWPPVLHQLNTYFKIADEANVQKKDTADAHFKLSVSVLPHPVVAGVLLPGLTDFTGAEVNAEFDKNKALLSLKAAISSIAYSGIKIADLNANMNGGTEKLDYGLTLASLQSGPVKLAQTGLSGSAENNAVNFALKIQQRDTLDKLYVAGDLKQDADKTYTVHLDNKKFVLSNERWQITDDNAVQFGKKGLAFHNLVLSNTGQLISLKTDDNNKGVIKGVLKDFQLGALSQIIEDDTAFIRGTLNGTVELRNLQGAPAFVSDLTVNDVYFKQNPVGNLTLKADNLTADRYSVQLALNGFDNDVTGSGYYSASAAESQLNFKVDIKKLNVISIQPFTQGQLRQSSGYISGSAAVSGTIKAPVLIGDIYFKNAAFNLAYINSYLVLKDEHLAIDPKGIYFRSFNILDTLGQKASITGAVYTSNFKNMRFDVGLQTDHFMVMNTSIKDNPLYFGKILLNSNIKVIGTEQLPKITADVKLIDGTSVAVVIPSSKISTDRGEGVVVLTDTVNDIMNPVDTVEASRFKGIVLNTNVEVTDKTNFKLIVDKSSGDSLVVHGAGLLSFGMDETGNLSLTGTYNLSGGGYKATFQKIVKRELKIQPGGAITWNGTPTDATVNLTAVYAVKTSPVDLLSSELTASTAEERNTYKRLLDFNVLMMMKGPLLKPEISFKLDMPEDEQNAFGGTVYAKVNSLNSDPSELNKQVFALLVMNKFIPAGVGGGVDYTAAATNLARNSLNQILTDQLNQLSGRYIKAVDLNVGINSNDEYTGSGVTQNTQVSASVKKSFFKERLSVQVGTSINVQNDNGAIKGTDAQNLTGDIVLEYKINEDGSLRFKAFRQNQYEGLIDGSVYLTGVGVVYSKDYDKEKELLIPKKKKAKNKKGNEAQP